MNFKKHLVRKATVVMAILCGLVVNSFGYFPIVWMVDDDGGAAFTTIQEGIDNCAPGDWVLVAPGTYNEVLSITTSNISIFAADINNKPLMDNGGATVATNGNVWINANNVTIKGLLLRFASGATPNAIGFNVTGNYVKLQDIDILGVNSGGGMETVVGIKFSGSYNTADNIKMVYTGQNAVGNVGVLMGNGSFSNNTVINSSIKFPLGVFVGSGNTNALLKNLNIVDDALPAGFVGIHNAGQSVIEGCEISGFNTGIQFQNDLSYSVSGDIIGNTISNAGSYGVYCAVGAGYSSVDVTLNDNDFSNCIDGIAGDGQIADPSRASVNIIIENYNAASFVNCINNTIEYESGYDNVSFDYQTTVEEWALGETYAVGDLVTYCGNEYRCLQAHTAYAPNWTPPNTPALWSLQ